MNEEKLRQLLDRYYDGATSPEEELELKQYFSGKEVLPGYEAEKEIFSHYSLSEKIPVPSDGFEMRIIKAVDDLQTNAGKSITRERYITFLSAAATILLLIGTWFIFFREKEPADSYSDPRIAYVETMKILNNVSAKLNRGTTALEPIMKISSTARSGMRSVDRSVSIITNSLKKAGLSEQFAKTENKSDTQ